jgi:hypothetical protein
MIERERPKQKGQENEKGEGAGHGMGFDEPTTGIVWITFFGSNRLL